MSDGLVTLAEPLTAGEDSFCKRICEHHRQEAQRIQTLLLPTRAPEHEAVEIAFRFAPFAEVGGDFADFFPLPDGMIGLYLGDVVGKGLPAAMYGALVMGTLRGIHKTGTDTARVLRLLNERLCQRPIPGRFCSTLYALFNPATNELIFSNAGVPLPLLISRERCQALGEGGIPSGLVPGADYGSHVVQLAAGDSVLFATDGLHEWRNVDGVEVGDERIGELWLQSQGASAGESIDAMFESVREFSQGCEAHDDTTAVVLRVRG